MAMIKQVEVGEGVALTLPDGTEALVFLHRINHPPKGVEGRASGVSFRIHAPREVRIDSADDRYDSVEERA